MAPVIRSRYEQYKRDTQQFTTWLAQTAISLGYPLSRFDHEAGNDVEIIVRSAASKKNARKKARAKELAQLAQEGLGKDDEITPSDASLGKCPYQLRVENRRLIPRCFWRSRQQTTSWQVGRRSSNEQCEWDARRVTR